MGTRSDLELLAGKIRYDLTALQGKVTELTRAIAALPADEQAELLHHCDRCIGGQSFASKRRLEEHLANVHAVGLDEDRTGSAPAPIAPALHFREAMVDKRTGSASLDELLPAPNRTGSASDPEPATPAGEA